MSFPIQKISSYILYVLLITNVIVMGLFYFGGIVPETAMNDYPEPVYTDLLIYWIYLLVAVGVLCTLGFGIAHFFKFVRNSPFDAIKSIAGGVLLILFLVLFWRLGDGTILNIPNYTGTSNTYFWLKTTDMYLYTIYLLLGLSVCTIIGFQVYRWIKQ